jgi:hypothetical protein
VNKLVGQAFFSLDFQYCVQSYFSGVFSVQYLVESSVQSLVFQ